MTSAGDAFELSHADREHMVQRDRQLIAFVVGLAILGALIAFLPDLLPPRASALVSDRAHAVILTLDPGSDESPPLATVQLLDGTYAGQSGPAVAEGPSGSLDLPDYQVGDEVVVAIDQNPDGTQDLAVVDRWRQPTLEWLLIGFALVTAAIAGWRGLRALTSLAITLVLVVRVLIPLLLSGWNAVGLAIAMGVTITILSFLFTQGFGRPTLAAVLGTAGGLLIVGVLAVLVSGVAKFTIAQGSQEIVALEQLGPAGAGGTDEGGSGASASPGESAGLAPGSDRGSGPASNGPAGGGGPVGIDLSGLVLAGVIFGSLGVLNDVAISQAVTVDELRQVDPTLSRRELYVRTMRIGVAHLAANINTLVFAYLGAGLPLLVLLAVQVRNLGATANEEFIAVEVVRAVVGAIGVLAAVPLTTALAAWLAGAPNPGHNSPATLEGAIEPA